MKKISLNFRGTGAAYIAAIVTMSVYTPVFAQSGNEHPKKEHTKIVTLKIVEDENGKVTKIDTTFISNGDYSSVFPEQYFKWNDDKNKIYDLRNLDSMNFNFKFDCRSLDSLEKSMYFINSDLDNNLKNLNEELRKLKMYNFRMMDSLEGDGMKKIWLGVGDDANDSIIWNWVKVMHGGHNSVEWLESPDTVITEGGKKIVVLSGNDEKDGRKMKTVTITSDDPSGENIEKTVVVTVDGDDVKILNSDNGKKCVVVKSKVAVNTPDNASKDELKSAGIKEKNGELAIDDLVFSPNPSNGKFNLSFTLREKKKVTINIYDMKGHIVYSESLKDFQGTYNKEIDISDKGTGPFFLQIVQGIYDIIKKLIIQ